MKQNVLRQAARYSKTHKRIKRWHRVVAGFAAVVVFITTYALILPALTQERATYCGYEEHSHSEGCYYQAEKELSCTASAHSHTDECLNAEGDPICGYANYLVHTHGKDCYNVNGVLVCRLPEIALHKHSAECYGASSGDESGEAVLVCNKAESVLHTHGEGCKDANGVLVCGMTELVEHIHTDGCFTAAEKAVLTCTLQEHKHSEDCYVDKTVDMETPEEWEASLPKELTGVWQNDAVAVAKTQLGYYESALNTVTGDDGKTYGYTRYGAWYGATYSDWDATFVSFCLYYAGVDREYFAYESDSKRWIEVLARSGYYEKASEHTPQIGDLVFFRTGGGDNAVYTVGIVTAYKLDESDLIMGIKAIVGDHNNRVQYVEYLTEDETIVGYGSLSRAYEEYRKNSPRVHTYTDDEVTVTATHYPAAGIPEDATLTVRPVVQEDGGEYDTCYREALAKLEAANGQVKTAKITDFKLYDISFYKDGQELQPNSKVDVKISFPSEALVDDAAVTVVHYAKEGTSIPRVQEYAVEDGSLNTSFETESFSLFAIVTSENFQNNIITLNKHNVSSNTVIRQLGGKTFAISNGTNALTVDSNGNLVTVPVLVQESGAITADETLCRWLFTKYSTSNYNYEFYISTVVNGTTYYLTISNGALQLSTTRARFTVGYSSNNATIRSGTSYINLSANGASVGGNTALSLHTLPTGEFTVNFDGQIGNAQYYDSSNHKFRLSENKSVTTTGGGYVTLPATMTLPGNYPLKLNGWYDIINMVYYDSSMLGKQIKVTNNTIFYPEWIAETYDIGQDVDVVKNQPDTSDFITTTVFDYNELFNTHSSTYSPSSGTWTFDPDSELGFIFFDYLTGGNIGNISGKDVSVNGVTVNQEKTAGTRGASTNFPGTITPGVANEARLNALFGNDPIAGRISLGEGDWLYSFDPEIGFYYYNSAKNAASYNQSKQRFYVYDYTVNIDSQNSLNDFLPFNYGKTTYKEKDNEANYWFGMKSEIRFYLPEESGSPLNIAADGKTDMQLRFSGDDDVWIFIDDELVLDLGGVHDVVYGEVNFATGKVKTGQAIDSTHIADNTADSYAGMPGVSGTAGVTTTDLPTVLAGGVEHTITIYYLERGSSLSNCSIYFNLSPSYEFEITKHAKDDTVVLEGAEFKVYDDEECTQPSLLQIQQADGTFVEARDVTFVTDANGVTRCWGLLLGKSYYIKEVKPPPGYTDMSHYTIRVNLSERGEVTYIALDSNGGQWVYADAFIFASDEGHRVEIDIYNDKDNKQFIGGNKKLYVEKVWAEGSENIPDEISVRLYANGEATERVMTISADTNWKGVFYSLLETDSDGNEIVYTVREEGISGYGATYTEVVGEDTVPGETIAAHWEQVTYLEPGYVYRLILPDYYGWAIKGFSSSTSIEPAIASDGYNDQLWRSIAADGGVYLQNVAYPNRYLGIGTNVVGTEDITGTDAILNLTGGYLVSRSNRYVQKGAKTTINGSGWGFYAVGTQDEATTVVAQKWVEAHDTTVSESVDGWRITNTPWDETLTIPVEKLWDATVSEANRQAVDVNLYLVTTGTETTVTYKGTISLNAENGYKSSFTELPYPEEGSYYCISEPTDKYAVSYRGETVTVFVDSAYHTAARITLDTYGKSATVSITNTLLVLLPETGGIGILLYYTVGGVLLAIAGAVTLYKRQQRRREVSKPS